METTIHILLIARPGIHRNGLAGVIAALPRARLQFAECNPASVQAALSQETPKLVLVDTRLPDKNLLKAITLIKSSAPAAKVIMLVDHISQYSIARSYGADDVLSHGTTTGDFLAAVADQVTNRHQARSKSIIPAYLN